MALHFQPKEGFILMCDFAGLAEPEMVKKRPVVILRRHKENSKLVTVVPLSTTAPKRLEDYHVELPTSPGNGDACWAKCDMVYTLSIRRLDRIMRRSRGGNRNYVTLKTGPEGLKAIRQAVRIALGLDGLK